MSDEIQYNYDAMDQAYENLLRATRAIEDGIETMTSDTGALLQRIGGQYAAQYESKVRVLKDDFDRLNGELTQRANILQDRFHQMGQTDIKLGDGM